MNLCWMGSDMCGRPNVDVKLTFVNELIFMNDSFEKYVENVVYVMMLAVVQKF